MPQGKARPCPGAGSRRGLRPEPINRRAKANTTGIAPMQDAGKRREASKCGLGAGRAPWGAGSFFCTLGPKPT